MLHYGLIIIAFVTKIKLMHSSVSLNQIFLNIVLQNLYQNYIECIIQLKIINSVIRLKMNQNQKGLPPIFRDVSQQRPNKLAKRLYKNNSMKKLNSTAQFSYLKSINPDSSILASTISKTNSSKNLLIPSISLKRSKQMNSNQKSLEITQGKILISKIQQPSFLHYRGDLKYNLQKTSNSKLLFKKINRHDGINEKKIIPDQLLGCSSDNDGSGSGGQSKFQRFKPSPKNKQSKLLKGFKSQTSSIIEDQQTLTPNDFIQLIQEDGTITNEFCYLKKMSHPYDLKIVQFQGKMNNLGNPSKTIKPSMISQQQQYITISSRGVSYFSKQNSRFVPLERWKKQAYYFNKLMNLEFFSKYRLFKNFAKWKKHIRKTAMKSTTDKLKNELLIGDKFLRKALLSAKDSCFILQNDINYCKFDDCQNVMQFSKFKSCQDQFIQNQFEKRIIQIQQDIKSNLIINMSDSMKQFKQQNKISTSNQGKGIPLLIGDQKNLDMPYTKQATLRIQQQRFKKFLKLIQFIIIDTKIKMMNESTQNIIKKIKQQNQNYQKQVIQNQYKFNFKGKQYIECYITLNIDEEYLMIKPTKEDINYMFQDIINKSIIKLCRNHKRIINDDDVLEIIYDSNQKIVKQSETNILKVIIMADDRQQKIVNMLNQTINQTYSYLQIYSSRFSNLVEMYFENLRKLDAIEQYTAKDHIIITQSIENWKNQLNQINALSQQHEAAIFLLNFRQFKQKAIKCVTQCFQKMKSIVPQIFKITTKTLSQSLQESLKKIQKKPDGIESFIQFQSNKNQITNCLQDYADRLAQINCIWMIMKTFSSNSEISNMTTISPSQKQSNKLQGVLNNLRAKLQEAEMNTKFFQTKAQQQVKQMIPKIKQNIYKLYMKIKSSKYDVNSDIQQVTSAIERNNKEYEVILTDIEKIKNYQRFLSMQEYNDQTINKFSNYFLNYQSIWSFRKNIFDYQIFILNQPWTSINVEQTKKQVEQSFNTALKLKKKITNQSADDQQFKIQLNDIDVLSYVFLQAKNMKPLVDTVQCLRDKSLGDKQFKQIKAYFQKNQKPEICAIIDIDNKQATLKDILDLKVSDELDFIQSVVFKSKKQMQIHNKMMMVNKFWIQSSGNNAGKNLADNFQKNYWDIITEIDQKITVINGISQDSEVQAQQLKQNILQNKTMLDTLRVLLTEWEIHQRYLHYFEPIFMNSYWKSIARQLKLYNQAQSNWKKLLKQCKDYSLKRWATNQKAIITLRENIALFEELKKAVEQFLLVKRQIFPKFYFLSNEQLLHILLSEKDFRSVQKHLNKAFTCLKSLDIKQQNNVPVGVQNLTSEYLQIRFARVNNFQIQQMFRMLEQSIKQSIKSNLRSCLNNFEKDQFNRKQWIKQNLLQILLFAQKSQYTKIIEYDYLGPDAQDLSQYLIYQNNQIKQLQLYLKDHSEEQGFGIGKIQTLIFQQIQHRQITDMLLKNTVVQEQSYDWQKQIRSYYTVDNAYTKFLVNEIDYGYEFVNLQSSYPYIILSDKETIDLSMALKLKHSPIIKGRQSLVSNFCKFNAKHYRNILCSKNISEKYLLNVCFGTYLQGCYIQFDAAQKLSIQQLSIVANFLKEIYSTLNRKDKTFSFGWKKNSINLHSGLIFKLSDSASLPDFSKNISSASRTFTFKDIPYSLYVDLIMETRKKVHNNIGLKIMKIIDVVNQLQGYLIFNFQNLKKLLNHDKMNQIQNFQSYFVKEILQLITQKIVSSKKLSFYKKILYQIFFDENNTQDISNQWNTQNQKNNKDKSDFKVVVNTLVQITDKKSLCVIAGPTQSGKISLISEAYRQRICRDFQVQILNTDIMNKQSLFGCYVNGLWKEGILINKLKQLASFKQEWIVFEGSYGQRIKNVMQKLNNSYLQLSNGEIVSLSSQWKFIFSIYNLDQKVNCLPKNIEIISSVKFISIEQSLYLMIQKRIKPYFEGNLDNYNPLSNFCINNFEKVLRLLTNLGFKSDYLKPQNILRYFIDVLEAIISNIQVQAKKNKQFSKGIQKIFIWSIYWTVGSGMPSLNSSRFENLLFDNIKTDIQSRNIELLKLDYQNPSGNFKKIKATELKTVNGQIYCEKLSLKAKAQFLQLMIKGNFPVILIGKAGSGKSKFMQYLQNNLNPEQYTYLRIKLRKQMKYEQFKDNLFKKTRISIKLVKKKCFCSSTNKKLIIMIDDFNLLDLNSQIGEFLSSCIKNGFYYDLVTNQKIYIHNISFVVAENQNYEFRIQNRFLKYFKPVFIDQIELKDIAQAYKQQCQNMQLARQIFDACVSLHNFVMNLQSVGQIRILNVFSHSNALRIMKCIKQYSHNQNRAKMWSYISKIQYTQLIENQQVCQKIQKQIRNLLNLITQNAHEKPKPVPYLSDLLQELCLKNELVKSDSQFQQYYEYLSFLLSLSEPHNLLSIGQTLPQTIKMELLKYTAQVHSLKFYYAKEIEILKNLDFKNSLIYLSTENQIELFQMMGYLYNNLQSNEARYVLDCPNKAYFNKIMKISPSVCSFFHIFRKKSTQSKVLLLPRYSQLLQKLDEFLGRKNQERQIVKIVSNLLYYEKYLKNSISKKKKNTLIFIQKYQKLDKDIEQNSKKIQELTQNIKDLQGQQQNLFIKKKQMSQTLMNMRNIKSEDQDAQQKRQKIKYLQDQINISQSQIKSAKSKKLTISEQLSILTAILNVSKQIYKKLQGHFRQFSEVQKDIQIIEQNESTIIFLISLYYFGISAQNNSQYIKFVEKQLKTENLDLIHIFKIIFDIEMKDKISQNIIIWALNNKKLIIKDKNNCFLRQIKQSVKKLRIYTEINNLLYDSSNNQPKVYIGKYDQRILDFNQCTYIISSQQQQNKLIKKQANKKIRILYIVDNEKNQKQSIKQFIYKNLQNVSLQQINNYLQQVYRLQNQNKQQNHRIITLFSQEKQLSLKILNDIKRQCNIYYSTQDRLKPLYLNIQKIQIQLQLKYKTIVQLCLLFKIYLETIEKEFNYFFFSSQRFEKIILLCLKKKSHGLMTKKQLIQSKFNSKKTFNNIKSKQQFITEKAINLQNAQIKQQQNKQISEKESPNKSEIVVKQEQHTNNILENFNKQVNVEVFMSIMIEQILNKVLYALKSQDAIFAYSLFACFYGQHKYNFSNSHREIFIKVLRKQSISIGQIDNIIVDILQKQIQTVTESEDLQDKTQLRIIYDSLKVFYQALKDPNSSAYENIINVGDTCLNMNFQQMLTYKYQLQFMTSKQSLLIISNQFQNPYEVLENHILNQQQSNSWCYFFEDYIDTQKITQMSQKSSIDWFVIVNNKNIQVFEQLRKNRGQKQLNLVFLYTEQQQFRQFKSKLIKEKPDYLKYFSLVYAQQNIPVHQKISNVYLKTVNCFSQDRPEIEQLFRLIYFEETTQLLRQIYLNYVNKSGSNQKERQNIISANQFYLTKTLNQILNGLKTLQLNNFIKYLFNICHPYQKQKQNIIIKQTKKILSKKQDILSEFIHFISKQGFSVSEELSFQGTAFVNQASQTITQNLMLNTPHQIINLFVYPSFKKKYPLDILFFWNSYRQKELTNQNSVKLNQTIQNNLILLKIDKLLNQLPAFTSLQSQTNKKQKYYYKDILKEEIRSKLNLIKKVQQSLKKYKKLLQTFKILSLNTQKQLKDLENSVLMTAQLNTESPLKIIKDKSIKQFLQILQKSIQYLQNFYQGKQNQKVFKPEYFKDPAHFLRYYLYQINTDANFKQCQIQARFLTQKDKQIHFDSNKQCNSLILPEVNIKNGKFDSIKNILQINQKNQLNKILNVHICFNNKQITHLNSSVPIYFQNQKLIYLSIINKVKEQSIWKDKLLLQIIPSNQ